MSKPDPTSLIAAGQRFAEALVSYVNSLWAAIEPLYEAMREGHQENPEDLHELIPAGKSCPFCDFTAWDEADGLGSARRAEVDHG